MLSNIKQQSFTLLSNLNTTFYSPLEQFENVFIGHKNFKPITEDIGLKIIWSFDINVLMDHCAGDFVKWEEYTKPFDTAFYFFDIAFLAALLSMLLIGISGKGLLSYLGIAFLPTWIITNIFTYLTTINNVIFEYAASVVPADIDGKEIDVVEIFIIPTDCGGLMFTDSLFFFITGALFLYLCTAFQDFNNAKGPFLVKINPITYVQITVHKLTVELLGSSIDKDINTQSYHAFVYGLFTYLTISNLQGLVPFTLTVTSHLIATFFLAQVVIMYVTSTILAEQGFKYLLTLFMPSGAPLLLGYLLIPIEFISFFFKTVSLSVRLFANMMAGHTLLKVILGFAWTLLTISEIYFIVNLFPIVILILLTVLEIGVSVIQAYIFSILTCLYLRDAFKGH